MVHLDVEQDADTNTHYRNLMIEKRSTNSGTLFFLTEHQTKCKKLCDVWLQVSANPQLHRVHCVDHC